LGVWHFGAFWDVVVGWTVADVSFQRQFPQSNCPLSGSAECLQGEKYGLVIDCYNK
jgi:hypothetical protein